MSSSDFTREQVRPDALPHIVPQLDAFCCITDRVDTAAKLRNRCGHSRFSNDMPLRRQPLDLTCQLRRQQAREYDIFRRREESHGNARAHLDGQKVHRSRRGTAASDLTQWQLMPTAAG